jgi:hypothetical protein
VPAPRTGLAETPTDFGNLQPRYSPDPGQSFSALDLDCPECHVQCTQPCAGERVCASRMAAARDAIAVGELPSRGPARPEGLACPDCGQEKRNARPLPCSDDTHRCPKVTSGYRCRFAIEPGGALCSHHQLFAPQAKPGRKPKLTPQVLARAQELRAAGLTIKEIAAELEVAEGTVVRWMKQNVPASE